MPQAFKPLSVCFDGPFGIHNETFMTGIRMKHRFKQLTKILNLIVITITLYQIADLCISFYK